MIFFLVHNVIQHSPWIKDWAESKKNITTFLIGSLLYVFLLSFLQSERFQSLINSSFFLFTLKNWFIWIIGIDITAMAILYKNYWGRTILEELPETWSLRRRNATSPTKTPAKKVDDPSIRLDDGMSDVSETAMLTNDADGRENYMPEGCSEKPLGDAYNSTIDDDNTQDSS